MRRERTKDERERERERNRQTHTDTHKTKQPHTQTPKQPDRERERELVLRSLPPRERERSVEFDPSACHHVPHLSTAHTAQQVGVLQWRCGTTAVRYKGGAVQWRCGTGAYIGEGLCAGASDLVGVQILPAAHTRGRERSRKP
eukprot:723732-Rhodomonas_salina.1